MLQLFPDEQIVLQSSEGAVTLTTHRICYEARDLGRSYNQNIMLEHITSCENYASTQIIFLILGGLAIIWALISGFNGYTEAFSTAMVIALIFGLLYWFTRRNFIVIASPSTKMQIKVTGMKRDKVLDFINKVEQAKHKRVLSLNNRPNTIV